MNERLAFLTGSHAHGTPHEKSDVDMAIFMDQDSPLFDTLCDQFECDGYDDISCSIKVGKLNLLIFHAEENYDQWRKVNELLVLECLHGRRPTRDEAVAAYKSGEVEATKKIRKKLKVKKKPVPVPDIPKAIPVPKGKKEQSQSEKYFSFVKSFCDASRELSQKKNADYADPDSKQDDPFAVFANFTACERIGICSTETGFMVRIMDKVVRISNLIRPGHERKVSDEAITDTLQDLHNYSVLFSGFLQSVKEHGRPTFADALQSVLSHHFGADDPEDEEPAEMEETIIPPRLIPVGFEWTGELRDVRLGEWFIAGCPKDPQPPGTTATAIDKETAVHPRGARYILRRKHS